METSIPRLTINEFLDRVASDEPTPGGGAVAALTGALAAALGEMACALTVGKPRFAPVETQVQEYAIRLRRCGQMLRDLTDEDAAAYDQLRAAFRLEKTDPARRREIERHAALAAAVPLSTVALSREVFFDLRRLRSIANPNLTADVDAGTFLAHAAMQAAAANVRVNVGLMSTESGTRVRSELDRLLVSEPLTPLHGIDDAS